MRNNMYPDLNKKYIDEKEDIRQKNIKEYQEKFFKKIMKQSKKNN